MDVSHVVKINEQSRLDFFRSQLVTVKAAELNIDFPSFDKYSSSVVRLYHSVILLR
jgi:hypothetical protein